MRGILLYMNKVIALVGIFCILLLAPVALAQTSILDAAEPTEVEEIVETELPNPGMLPDSPLYFLKLLTEEFRGVFVFGQDSKALYSLKLADKRLGESKALVDKGKPELAAKTAEKAAKKNEKAQKQLKRAEAKGKDVTSVVERLAANSTRQQAVLATVLERVPEQAKAAIQRAMQTSQRGLLKAQEMQTKEKDKVGEPDDIGSPAGTKGKPDNLPGRPL